MSQSSFHTLLMSKIYREEKTMLFHGVILHMIRMSHVNLQSCGTHNKTKVTLYIHIK